MPQIDEQEIAMVTKVLKSGVLTTRVTSGSMVERFEGAFADFVNARHAVAVNSGTAALHMALWVSGIKTGDEVIVPSFTFIASAEAVALTGAKPVFVDINPRTYNIDPEKIEAAITERTRAIMPVDLYGLSAEMDTIKETAEKHSLKIIEDAAQAHGATFKGKPPGYFADMACWSFYASKNMTTGEGGMITTDNEELADNLRWIRSHGEKEEYVSSMLGHNYRMPEMEAAMGIVQLQKLPAFVEKRRKNAKFLTERLSEIERLQLPIEPRGCKHSWYLYTVRLRDSDKAERDEVVEKLRKRGVGATVYYQVPIHLMPYYRKFSERRLPETEKAARQVFSLPVHPGVTPKEIHHVADSVVRVVK